ncbi:MAG: tRNA (guanosine(37)-N1)-methyltransferase TrmD [Pseudomonadota bacterium]
MTPRRPFHAIVGTLFPEMFPGPLGRSLLGTALNDGIWTLKTLDFRDFSTDKHRSVDAPPAGGGPGLVMRPDIAAGAIDKAQADAEALVGSPIGRTRWPVIYLSPRGAPFTQARARELAAGDGVTLLCGRFEGIDERALEARGVEEICVGDAVYTGGEIPAMAVLDAVLRLLPGVLGDPESLEEESFAAGLLEHPQYTRPTEWEGRAIPEVLLSGHHANVNAWRRARSEALTKERRPDLWKAHLSRQEDGQAPAEQSDADKTKQDDAS